MRAGGLYDQVGGGFHRYSTDVEWLVPHFEKMLYDSALLAATYLEAAQATGDSAFIDTTRETLDYLLREMRAPDGTFYSATDADSPTPEGRREEGWFFTWTPRELRSVLSADDLPVALAFFGVTDAGNFEGRTILTAHRSRDEVARELGVPLPALEARLGPIRHTLLEARGERPPPLRDEKALVSWNALVVTALARAAIVLGDARYADACVRASEALVAREPLPHLFVDGAPRGRAFADDYALLAAALLDVFELTSDSRWLTRAIALMDEIERAFVDEANGGYFLTAAHHEALLFREKPARDGPIPSVGSVAAMMWLRLHTLTDDDRFRRRAETTLRAFARTLEGSPLALDQMLLALDWATDVPKEIVVVVPEGEGALAPAARPLLDVLARTFVPNAVVVVGTMDALGALRRRVPWVEGKTTRPGIATAYVCERGACQLPTSDASVLARQLAEARAYP
jgi:uncharacterized protein YyaL (SSP411 family)